MRCLLAIALVAALQLTGCKPAQPIVPDNLLPDPVANEQPLPTYGDLIRRYNATTEPLVRVWASARVNLLWLNEKGKKKSEHGDGKFMFVSPDKLSLKIEEFGKGFHAGGDGERYWYFDTFEEPTVYVGRFDKLDELDAATFPLPVKPTDLPYVMGLLPIDPDLLPEEPAVERVVGHYLIEPPGLGLRILLHPETARPVRVDLLAADGSSKVKCLLSEPVEIEIQQDTTDGSAPIMASRVEVYVLDEEVRMTLKLKGLTTDGRRIKSPHFVFETLMDVYKPELFVDLDAANPAAPIE